jgi:hypothetical protein
LLKPLVSRLVEIHEVHPIKVGDSTIMMRFRLIGGAFDLPAKAAILNVLSFNGRNKKNEDGAGCTWCKHPGGYKGRTIYSWDPDFDGTKNLKEHHEMIEAYEAGYLLHYMKGDCELRHLVGWDMVISSPVDFLHCVYVGIMKKWLKLVFNDLSPIDREDLNAALDSAAFPHDYSRPYRSYSIHHKQWKGVEYLHVLKNLLPVFEEFVGSRKYRHIQHLAYIVVTLSAREIPRSELDVCHKHAIKFNKGVNNIQFNV